MDTADRDHPPNHGLAQLDRALVACGGELSVVHRPDGGRSLSFWIPCSLPLPED